MGATVLQFNSMAREIESRNAEETKRASSARIAAVQAAPVSSPQTTSVPLPSREACKTYMSAQIAARSQTEHANALRAFVGYDQCAPCGAQQDAARRLCAKVLNAQGTAISPYTRSSSPTMQGFIAGMPDHRGREIAALQAQCRALVEDMGTKDAERLLRIVRQRLADLGASA